MMYFLVFDKHKLKNLKYNQKLFISKNISLRISIKLETWLIWIEDEQVCWKTYQSINHIFIIVSYSHFSIILATDVIVDV